MPVVEEPWRESIQKVSVFPIALNRQFPLQDYPRERGVSANVGGGRLTERESSCVGGSRGLDRVERRLRAEAANIPLSNEDKGGWGGIRKREGKKEGRKEEEWKVRDQIRGREKKREREHNRSCKCLGCLNADKRVKGGQVWSRTVTVDPSRSRPACDFSRPGGVSSRGKRLPYGITVTHMWTVYRTFGPRLKWEKLRKVSKCTHEVSSPKIYREIWVKGSNRLPKNKFV